MFEDERDGEVTELGTATVDLGDAAELPSLAEQRTARRKRRGLARDLQRPARVGGAA